MNYQHYTKPWLSFEDQLQHLKDNGLEIEDCHTAQLFLERIGYYRLSGYWFPFRERSGLCCPLDYKRRKKKKTKGYTNHLELDQFRTMTKMLFLENTALQMAEPLHLGFVPSTT